MRSRSADRFDHDAGAVDYDVRVADESILLRRGYSACLRALSEDLRQDSGPRELPVVELGAGTGALTAQVPSGRPVVAVDISPAMLAVARRKLEGRAVELVQDDLLAWVTESDEPLGTVVAAFALHLLDQDEKAALLKSLARRMVPGARLCIGDLGVADAAAHARWLEDPTVQAGVSAAVAQTWLWRWDVAEDQLRGLGFRLRWRQHGPLIRSLIATR